MSGDEVVLSNIAGLPFVFGTASFALEGIALVRFLVAVIRSSYVCAKGVARQVWHEKPKSVFSHAQRCDGPGYRLLHGIRNHWLHVLWRK